MSEDQFTKNSNNVAVINTISLFCTLIGLLIIIFSIVIQGRSNHDRILGLINNTDEIKGFNSEVASFIENNKTGVVKEILEPHIWELEGHIMGWNPNWAIETKQTARQIYLGIRKVHKNRILSPDVDCIEYVFFENYQSPIDEDLRFGVDNFVAFINSLASEIESSDPDNLDSFIKNTEKKFRLWIVPKNNWMYSYKYDQIIAPYKDLIFIRGSRYELQNLVMFMNMPGFVSEGTHNYYIELYRDNTVTQSLVDCFEKTTNLLKEDAISSASLKYDKKDGFTLQK